MDSESNPSAGGRWAEAWAGQGLSEQLGARLLCCVPMPFFFFFLHFARCLCPVVKCVGVQMTLLGQRVHLFVINLQALPPALRRFPP